MFYVGMDNISFTSRIRPVGIDEFQEAITRISKKQFVDSPWTIKQSVLSDRAYTKDILDCTVCGITNKDKVLLMHICPTNPKNKKFSDIEKYINKIINLNNKDLQGFILGSKRPNFNSPNTEKLFEKFVKFMKDYKIPFSQFKGGPFENHVAYSSAKDEWLIGNCLISKNMKQHYYDNPQAVLKRIFDKVEVSDLDEVVW